jgi:predicted nucleic acid-binding protein
VSPPVVIVDTNVVVAGLLTANSASNVARVLDGMLTAAFPFAVSEALLAEYRTVLVRAKLRELHGLTIAEVETILTDLAQHAIVLAPVGAPPAPDPGDQLLWDLLATRADLVLGTGDRLLVEDAGMQGRVVSPYAFMAGAYGSSGS